MLKSLVLTILSLALIIDQTFQASVKYGNNPCPTPGWNPCPPEIPIQPLTQPTQPPQPPQPSYHLPEPSYHPPQPQPSYQPPQPQPSYHPPQPQPSYHPPQPQPSYQPPQPQPSYNPPQPSYQPPQPQPSYNPPQPEPSYNPPQPEPSYNPPQPSYHPPQPQPSYNPVQPSFQPPEASNPCGGGYQNPCTPVEHNPQPSYPQPEPSSNGNHRDNPLYCYSCNSNQPACQNPYNYTRLDIEHLVPCNGQCIRYQNPNDRYNWYRGCSWEYDFMKPQPSSVHKNGITYYFCETRGCNAIC